MLFNQAHQRDGLCLLVHVEAELIEKACKVAFSLTGNHLNYQEKGHGAKIAFIDR